MSSIRILPDILSNKIAAGEVVERPASVVKELVENALDAGASRILIDIEQGGRSLIRVADDGSGMSRDDALLSIERHATSKIASDKDLFNIHTLGFRGEALPSIAAVSHMTLVTRTDSCDAGTAIRIEGGKLIDVAEAGAPTGTLVEVRQLFFNTPARRKFLKSISTEMAHIGDILAGMALAWPRVQFRLTHNDRVVKNWPAAADPFERVVDVLGGGLREDLHAITLAREGLSVGGWVSSPRIRRTSSNGVFILVNRRCVRDRLVQHALFQGYFQRLVKGQFPVAVLFIDLPFDQVDVNVHPAKNEVRFARSHDVHELIRRAVAQTLYDVDRPGFQQKTPETNQVREEGGVWKGEEGSSKWEGGEPKLEVGSWKAEDYRGGTPLPQPADKAGVSLTPSPLPLPPSRLSPSVSGLQADIWQQRGFAGLRVIGQLHNTYIVCETEDGLILIDQHAAHERVLYDQLGRRPGSQRPAAQTLLVPDTVDLSFQEAQALEALMPQLQELGFDVEPFGGATVVVKAVPGFFAGREVRPLLTEIAEKAAAFEDTDHPGEALDFCRQRAACHGAIRAGQKLTMEQMEVLLKQIDACGNLSHCPHGRPTWIKWETGAIERLFKRT
jgi:DNA mismatch repair protein MutL